MERYGPSRRNVAVYACVLMLGLLVYPLDARSAAAAPNGPPRFEQASVAVLAGSNCILHPEGSQDPNQSIRVVADADGVARFLAVRATRPNSVDRLVLDCTDSHKRTKTYSIDLRSEATFAPHPFDSSRTSLAVRPALTGDPRRFTQEELIKAGYGPRPDATANPDAYRRWLAAATVPMRKLPTDHTLSPFPTRPPFNPNLSGQSPAVSATVYPRPSFFSTGTVLRGFLSAVNARVYQSPPDYWTGAVPQGSFPALTAKVVNTPSNYWTGAVLQGSYHKGATSASTDSYGEIFAALAVPRLTPGPTATMTVWDGLDNVCQTIIDVNTTATAATLGIHHQCFHPHIGHTDTAGVNFTPQSGDDIELSVWYCDANGGYNLSGGYACTLMVDTTQAVTWECDQANSSDCPSYKFETCTKADKPQSLCNIGRTAEFIIEDDSPNAGEWPIFSPVTMNGTAWVFKGNGAPGSGPSHGVGTTADKYVGIIADPLIQVLTDSTKSTRHLRITLASGVKWSETTCTAKQKWNSNSGTCVSKK